MKPATRVPTRDASDNCYTQSNVTRVSRVQGHDQTRANSLIVGESIMHSLIREDFPNLSIHPIRRDERHSMKWNGLAFITVGTGVGCFHC
jgi:hypothetical protein